MSCIRYENSMRLPEDWEAWYKSDMCGDASVVEESGYGDGAWSSKQTCSLKKWVSGIKTWRKRVGN